MNHPKKMITLFVLDENDKETILKSLSEESTTNSSVLAAPDTLISDAVHVPDQKKTEPVTEAPPCSIDHPSTETDYRLTYANNINAGTATVTITGKGDYTGTASRQFVIEALSLRKAVVTVSVSSYVFNGKARKPDTEVVLDGKTLERDEDYSVRYSNNTNIGTAQVIFTINDNCV